MDDGILDQQLAYYRARAAEYDDWWERRNDYDEGPELLAAWQADIAELRAWLDVLGPLGDVVELAAGTGNWTVELTARAASVTALDAAPEVLAINAAKLAERGVRATHQVVDLFAWEPDRTFDTVYFSIWLSHVPPVRWQAFWRSVRAALAPDGRVVFIDSSSPAHSAENGPSRRRAKPDRSDAEHRETRRLRDGATYEIVKRYWTPTQLVAELDAEGWAATCETTSFAFIRGTAAPR